MLIRSLVQSAKAAFEREKGIHCMSQYESRSEIAMLRQQIALEYEAAQRGLSGFAQGAAQHAFINQRLENMSRHHETLRGLVGEQEATKLLVDAMMEADVGTNG